MSILTLVAAFTAPDKLPTPAADQAQMDAIVQAVFFVAGAVTILFMLLNALKYIYSSGDAGRLREAKDGILYGLVGLIIVLISFGIVQFIIRTLQ